MSTHTHTHMHDGSLPLAHSLAMLPGPRRADAQQWGTATSALHAPVGRLSSMPAGLTCGSGSRSRSCHSVDWPKAQAADCWPNRGAFFRTGDSPREASCRPRRCPRSRLPSDRNAAHRRSGQMDTCRSPQGRAAYTPAQDPRLVRHCARVCVCVCVDASMSRCVDKATLGHRPVKTEVEHPACSSLAMSTW